MSRTHRLTAIALVVLLAGTLSVTTAGAQQRFDIALTAAEEVPPPTGTPGSGSATVTIDTNANVVTVNGSYSGMSSTVTAAHIHGFAAPGATAGVLQGLTVSGGTSGTISGVYNYLEADEANVIAGLMYINVHTVTNGPGEIRGQIPAVTSTIPAASTWALLALALLLGGVGFAWMRRRATTA